MKDAIAETGWLSVSLTLGIAAQICSALCAVHELGLVHCDMKPGNIMLTCSPDGKLIVKVLDFGIAKILPVTGDTVLKLTQDGNMLGSLLYMSPEQCLDQEVDARSDLYSLGCVIYEALTGKPPICARTAFETMNKHLTAMPAPLETTRSDIQWPKKLAKILTRAYAKKPDDRYQSISEFLNALMTLEEMPSELQWPERWSKRSVRIEDDAKSREIKIENIASLKYPVSTNVTVEPPQSIDDLVKSLNRIAETRILAMIPTGFAILAALSAVISANTNALLCVLNMIIGLFCTLAACGLWRCFLNEQKLPIVKKAGLSNASSVVKNLKPQRISVLKIVKFPPTTVSRNSKSGLYSECVSELVNKSYVVDFEIADSTGNVTLKKLIVRPVPSENQHLKWGSVWRKIFLAGQNEKFGADASAEIALNYPLPGNLFSDRDGEPMAISIENSAGWIYPD